MRWNTDKWFGGFKTECEECHHYAVGKKAQDARDLMRARLTDYWCPYCTTCSIEAKPRGKEDEDLSLTSQLMVARKEIEQLKQSVKDWKNAWFEGRDIIGNMWWHHKAIDNDEYRAYCQANLKAIKEMKP
jgi:hypothetical protein